MQGKADELGLRVVQVSRVNLGGFERCKCVLIGFFLNGAILEISKF
jgi:hypothetical protein